MWLCMTGKAQKGCAYWLPTDGDVQDFVKQKVDRFINENAEVLPGILETNQTYNVGMKFLFGVPTFWRGIKSRSKVKSISADATVFDEFDEADPEQVYQARERMSASEVKLVRELSTPTIPDFGIDKRFAESDQRHIHFKCSNCGHLTCLELTFPDCMVQQSDSKWRTGCAKCKAPIDTTTARWISMNPSSDIRGYQISQLYSPFVTSSAIMHEFHNTEFPQHFWNHKIGLPFLNASNRVSFEEAISNCDPLQSKRHLSQTACAMGVDVGRVLHWTIIQPGTPKRIIAFGEAKTFEELPGIANRYNVSLAVIDALPEIKKIGELKKADRRFWDCFYSQNQRGQFTWQEDKRTVVVNRTEVLDMGTDDFHEKKILLPQRTQEVETFCQHVSNVAKTVEENKETGDKIYIYKKLGPDHYRHSLGYAYISLSKIRTAGIVSVFR